MPTARAAPRPARSRARSVSGGMTHPGDLVGQVVRLLEAAQRGHREQQRRVLRGQRGHHPEQRVQLVDGPADQEVRPGADLGPGPGDLGLRVLRAGVDPGADAERGLGGQREPVGIAAGVQAGQQRDQAERVDLPDPVHGRVVAKHRRAAGGADHAADTEGVRAEQFGLQGHDGLVPGGQRGDGLHAGLLLQMQRHVQGVGAGAGALGRLDREHPDALGLEHRRGLHRLGGPPSGRERGRDDEPAAGQLVGEGPGDRGGRTRRTWRLAWPSPRFRRGGRAGTAGYPGTLGWPGRAGARRRRRRGCARGWCRSSRRPGTLRPPRTGGSSGRSNRRRC